jgi:hypothetical protein
VIESLKVKVFSHWVEICSVCVLWIRLLNLPILDAHFPVPVSITLIRSRSRPSPLEPHWLSPLWWSEELYGTLYQSGSFSFISVGSGFHCLCILCIQFWKSVLSTTTWKSIYYEIIPA